MNALSRVAQAARAPLQFVVQPALTDDVPGGVGRLQQFAAGFSQQVSPGIKLARAVATYDVTLARGLAEATSRDVRGRIEIADAYVIPIGAIVKDPDTGTPLVFAPIAGGAFRRIAIRIALQSHGYAAVQSRQLRTVSRVVTDGAYELLPYAVSGDNG